MNNQILKKLLLVFLLSFALQEMCRLEAMERATSQEPGEDDSRVTQMETKETDDFDLCGDLEDLTFEELTREYESKMINAAIVQLSKKIKLNKKQEDLLAAHRKTLRELDLSNPESSGIVTDEALENFLTESLDIHTLDLSGCKHLTDKTFIKIASKCQKLQSIDISGCSQVTDLSITAFASRCPLLSYIKLFQCTNLNNVKVLQLLIQKCPGINYLNVSQTGYKLTPELTAWFKKSRNKLKTITKPKQEKSERECTSTSGSGYWFLPTFLSRS